MGKRTGCPGGVYGNTIRREYEIVQEWTDRATKKNDRIIAEGYAERQMAETLRMIGKIETEL